MTLGYDALRHLGSLKPPIYETSTFVFSSAAEGKAFFEKAYGDAAGEGEAGYIYSRLDFPNLAPVEARLAAWEDAEDAVMFGSGMGAISTLFLTLLRPGDLVVYRSDASHVGMYMGNGQVIHAPHPGAPVRYDPVGMMPVSSVTRV